MELSRTHVGYREQISEGEREGRKEGKEEGGAFVYLFCFGLLLGFRSAHYLRKRRLLQKPAPQKKKIWHRGTRLTQGFHVSYRTAL